MIWQRTLNGRIHKTSITSTAKDVGRIGRNGGVFTLVEIGGLVTLYTLQDKFYLEVIRAVTLDAREVSIQASNPTSLLTS